MRKPTLPDSAKRAKKWLLEHGVRSVDITGQDKYKAAGSLEDGDKPSETETEQKDFGGRSERYRFAQPLSR